MICLVWLSAIHAYMRLHEEGVPMLAVRYEDLTSDPSRVLATILAYVGMSADMAKDALPAFERDSQAGSPISREDASWHTGEIDERQWEWVRDLVRRYPITGGEIPTTSATVPSM
ncbi:MAG TPA: hypothetical protein VF221_14825 [Chloroflexota bacterium]